MSTSINHNSLRLRNDVHLLRKLWHMGTGVLGLFIYSKGLFGQYEMAYLLLALALTGFIVEFIRFRSKSFNNFVMQVMGPFMRESERHSYSGLVFYAFGVSLSLFIFKEKIAILSILFLVFADPISSFFGILFGKEKILPNKSLQGTLAGFFTCYLLSLFYTSYFGHEGLGVLLFSLLAGILGAVSELLSVWADDNLTIPLVSGAGLTLLNQVFFIF